MRCQRHHEGTGEHEKHLAQRAGTPLLPAERAWRADGTGQQWTCKNSLLKFAGPPRAGGFGIAPSVLSGNGPPPDAQPEPAMALHFDTAFEPGYGTPVPVAPGIVRVTAKNPGPFTFHGTNSYIVGTRRPRRHRPGAGRRSPPRRAARGDRRAPGQPYPGHPHASRPLAARRPAQGAHRRRHCRGRAASPGAAAADRRGEPARRQRRYRLFGRIWRLPTATSSPATAGRWRRC